MPETTPASGQSTQHPYEVSVTGDTVVVRMGANESQSLVPNDFSTREPSPAEAATEMIFYVAHNAAGTLDRSVSASAKDRQVVAALVGNWIAEGLDVQRVNRKEFMKRLRLVPAPGVVAVTTPVEPAGAANESQVVGEGQSGSDQQTQEMPQAAAA